MGNILDAAQWHDLRASTLWSVQGGMRHEIQRSSTPWWFENARRQPQELVILQYLRQGRAVLRREGQEFEIRPGQAFLFYYGETSAYGRPSDRPDWDGHDHEVVTDYLTLHGAGLAAHWEVLSRRVGPVFTLAPQHPLLGLLETLIGEAMAGRSVPATQVALLVDRLGDGIACCQAALRHPVEAAIEAILADPWRDHALKTLASTHGCSREHLIRQFQARVGMSPARWLRSKRLARAVELLRETDLPVVAVAQACGAGSVHRLAGWTRDAHGLPPERLRQQLRS